MSFSSNVNVETLLTRLFCDIILPFDPNYSTVELLIGIYFSFQIQWQCLPLMLTWASLPRTSSTKAMVRHSLLCLLNELLMEINIEMRNYSFYRLWPGET